LTKLESRSFRKKLKKKLNYNFYNTHMSDPSLLNDKWDLYYHLPTDSNWDLDSYKPIMKGVNIKDQITALNQSISSSVIKNCMLFVMRDSITPRWEDNKNRDGGCFSYKVPNKLVTSAWKRLFTDVCMEKYSLDTNVQSHINGITISPKKNFCIIKVWMDTVEHTNPTLFNHIPNLNANGCIFKEHQPTN